MFGFGSGGIGSSFEELLRRHDVADPGLWAMSEVVRQASSDLAEYPDPHAFLLDVACRGVGMLNDDQHTVELVGVVLDDIYNAKRDALLADSNGGGDA